MWTKDGKRNGIRKINLTTLFTLGALALGPCLSRADDHGGGNDRYQQMNLVSDVAGAAILQDTNLVNAWGISFGPTTPFWVSANGTGLSTLYQVTYDASGMVQVAKVPLEVTIPGEGNPTGQLFTGTTDTNKDLFIFSSEDGTISGWRRSLGTAAEVLVSRPGAVYKGITMAMTAFGPALLAANFTEGTVDVYDTNLTLRAQARDWSAPEDYSPFNVQLVGGQVFVTFAKHSPGGEDDVAGRGRGIIDVLDTMNGNMHRFATGTDAGGNVEAMNSPWGLTLAPASFGENAGRLLVGNFGSGTIMTFDVHSGKFRGLLRSESGGPMTIDGLWGLTTGNGTRAGRPETVYFSAGPGGEGHGLFGSLDAVSHRGRHGDD